MTVLFQRLFLTNMISTVFTHLLYCAYKEGIIRTNSPYYTAEISWGRRNKKLCLYIHQKEVKKPNLNQIIFHF